MFLKKVKLELLTLNVCSVSMLCPILCNPWTVVHQAQTLSMGFPRKKNTAVVCHFLLQLIAFISHASKVVLKILPSQASAIHEP